MSRRPWQEHRYRGCFKPKACDLTAEKVCGACAMHRENPPSLHTEPHLSRKHAEMLLAHLAQQPAKKWRPIIRSLVHALRENPGNHRYEEPKP